MDHEIRRYKNEDADAVSRIEERSGICLVSIFSDEKKPLLVATADNAVVGCIWGVLDPTVDLDVAVDVEHRGRGLARRLVLATVTEFELIGREVTVSVTNEAMKRLASELGLVPDSDGNWRGVIALPVKATPA